MSAADYPITFGYRATDGYYYGPNGIVGKYHRGNDRPCPMGTPIVIGSTTIGHTGASGLASGPHLHTQVCTAGSSYADDFSPAPYEFKYGTVIKAGWHNQFGNHIVIRVGGVDITYAHLSQINVSAGQILSAPQGSNINMFNTREEVTEAYVQLRGVPGTQAEMQAWVGQSKQRWIQLSTAETNSTRQQLADVKQALANEQAKPPKEIIKEVQVIVEKPVEVIKEIEIIKEIPVEVEKPTTWTSVVNFFREQLNKFLKKG